MAYEEKSTTKPFRCKAFLHEHDSTMRDLAFERRGQYALPGGAMAHFVLSPLECADSYKMAFTKDRHGYVKSATLLSKRRLKDLAQFPPSGNGLFIEIDLLEDVPLLCHDPLAAARLWGRSLILQGSCGTYILQFRQGLSDNAWRSCLQFLEAVAGFVQELPVVLLADVKSFFDDNDYLLLHQALFDRMVLAARRLEMGCWNCTASGGGAKSHMYRIFSEMVERGLLEGGSFFVVLQNILSRVVGHTARDLVELGHAFDVAIRGRNMVRFFEAVVDKEERAQQVLGACQIYEDILATKRILDRNAGATGLLSELESTMSSLKEALYDVLYGESTYFRKQYTK